MLKTLDEANPDKEEFMRNFIKIEEIFDEINADEYLGIFL